ncbi:unnamed protein product, partial [Allacma fusca]
MNIQTSDGAKQFSAYLVYYRYRRRDSYTQPLPVYREAYCDGMEHQRNYYSGEANYQRPTLKSHPRHPQSAK